MDKKELLERFEELDIEGSVERKSSKSIARHEYNVEWMREWTRKNKDLLNERRNEIRDKEQRKIYYQENREEICKKTKEQRKIYYQENREEICKKTKEYKEKNKEKVRKYNLEYMRKWRKLKKLQASK